MWNQNKLNEPCGIEVLYESNKGNVFGYTNTNKTRKINKTNKQQELKQKNSHKTNKQNTKMKTNILEERYMQDVKLLKFRNIQSLFSMKRNL